MKQNRRMQYFVAFGVSLTSFTCAVVLYWSVPILPTFLNNEIGFNMTSSEVSWMVSMTSPGNVAGSLISRAVSDKLGRRVTLMASALPFITGAVLVLCATNAWPLFIARVLWGCGTGMTSTVALLYLPEISDKDIRGRLTVGTRIMFNLGATVVLIVGSFVSYQILTCMIIGFALCYFTVCWWVPETPYFLLKVGKVDEARKAISQLSGLKDDKEIEEKLTLMRSDVKREMARSGSVKALFTSKQYRKALIITAGLRTTQVMAGSIAIQQYLGPIVQESNCGIKVSTAMIVFGIVRFAVVFLASILIDKVGRRPLLMSSFTAAALTLTVIGLYFFFQDIIELSGYRYLVFIAIIIYKIVANLGFDILIFVVPGEIFPLNVKAVAMSILNIYSSFVVFAVTRGFQIMKDLTGLHGVFWFYATGAATGAIFTYFIVPETRGKSLREIQMELQGDMFGQDSEQLNQVVTADAADIDDEVDQATELTSMRSADKETLR